MELRLGSVWLLLSCSLQQSLWGILASVPQIHGKKCSHSLSSGDSRTAMKRVQMIRRIPARCSGWDEAWSWISKLDCRTKYVLDYFDIPGEVQKSANGDTECIEGEAQAKESSDFDPTDEKFLAIAFASATVALLILIVVIVVSFLRKGSSRCGAGPRYRSANGGERERLEDQHTCNDYVDDVKSTEPEYEEIPDRNHGKLKSSDVMYRYENTFTDSGYGKEQETVHTTNDGVIVPSAPREEDLRQTSETSVCTTVTAADNKVATQTETLNGLEHSINTISGEINMSTIKGNNEEKTTTDDIDDKCVKRKDGDSEFNQTLENDYTIFEDLVKKRNPQTMSTDDNIPLSKLDFSASPTKGTEPMLETTPSPLDTSEPINGEAISLHNTCETTDASLCSPTRLESTEEIAETETSVAKPHSYEKLDPHIQGSTANGYESLLSYGTQSDDTC